MRRRLRVERLADVGQEVRRRRRMRRVGRRALQDERLPDLLVAQHADEDLAAADGDLIRNLRRANVQVFKKSSGQYYKKTTSYKRSQCHTDHFNQSPSASYLRPQRHSPMFLADKLRR